MKTQPSDPNEEPFPVDDSKDRLWALLGKARNCEAPPNFVQNVVREARLSADEASGFTAWLARLAEKFQRPAFALTATATAAVAIALVVAVSQSGDNNDSSLTSTDSTTTDPIIAPASTAVEIPAVPRYTVSDQLDDIDLLGDLVAVTDPAVLNDQMLADLLY